MRILFIVIFIQSLISCAAFSQNQDATWDPENDMFMVNSRPYSNENLASKRPAYKELNNKILKLEKEIYEKTCSKTITIGRYLNCLQPIVNSHIASIENEFENFKSEVEKIKGIKEVAIYYFTVNATESAKSELSLFIKIPSKSRVLYDYEYLVGTEVKTNDTNIHSNILKKFTNPIIEYCRKINLENCDEKKSVLENLSRQLSNAVLDFQKIKIINDYFRKLIAIDNRDSINIEKYAVWNPNSSKKTICSMTMESTDEIEAFKKALPKDKFQFTELIPMTYANYPQVNLGETWLAQVCQKKIQCDALIISAHFAGNFWGKYQKTGQFTSMNLSTLENYACTHECSGIFERPLEVFIFGCNALASKQKDLRTPEEYHRVLIDHVGMSAEEASRVVEARYGVFGSSFKERIQQSFPKSVKIWGFDTVSADGKILGKFINGDLLPQLGNYDIRLNQLEQQRQKGVLQLSSETMQGIKAPVIMKSCPGIELELTSNKADLSQFTQYCDLKNPKISFLTKINILSKITEKNFTVALPLIEEFLLKNPPEKLLGNDLEAFNNFKNNEENKKKLSEIFEKVKTPAFTKILVNIGKKLDWFNKEFILKKYETDVFPTLIKIPIRSGNISTIRSMFLDTQNPNPYLGYLTENERPQLIKILLELTKNISPTKNISQNDLNNISELALTSFYTNSKTNQELAETIYEKHFLPLWNKGPHEKDSTKIQNTLCLLARVFPQIRQKARQELKQESGGSLIHTCLNYEDYMAPKICEKINTSSLPQKQKEKECTALNNIAKLNEWHILAAARTDTYYKLPQKPEDIDSLFSLYQQAPDEQHLNYLLDWFGDNAQANSEKLTKRIIANAYKIPEKYWKNYILNLRKLKNLTDSEQLTLIQSIINYAQVHHKDKNIVEKVTEYYLTFFDLPNKSDQALWSLGNNLNLVDSNIRLPILRHLYLQSLQSKELVRSLGESLKTDVILASGPIPVPSRFNSEEKEIILKIIENQKTPLTQNIAALETIKNKETNPDIRELADCIYNNLKTIKAPALLSIPCSKIKRGPKKEKVVLSEAQQMEIANNIYKFSENDHKKLLENTKILFEQEEINEKVLKKFFNYWLQLHPSGRKQLYIYFKDFPPKAINFQNGLAELLENSLGQKTEFFEIRPELPAWDRANIVGLFENKIILSQKAKQALKSISEKDTHSSIRTYAQCVLKEKEGQLIKFNISACLFPSKIKLE